MSRFPTAVFTCCLLLATAPARANPTDENPEAMLDAARETSAELLLEAQVLYTQAAEEVAQYEENLRDGKYKTGEARVIANVGKTSLSIARLERLARRLTLMAEPAGVDIGFRASELRHRIRNVINTYHRLPNALQLINASTAPLPRMSAGKAQSLKGIGTLFSQGKLDMAEKRLYETILDEFEPILAWQNELVVRETLKPFMAAQKAIDDKLLEARQAETAEALAGTRAESSPQFNELKGRMQASIDEIGSSGRAEWDGGKLDGPNLLAAWHRAWREAQVKTMHCRAMDWARGVKAGVRPPSELDELEAAYLQFDAGMGPAVEALIAADAGRALPDIVPALYARYVGVLAEITPAITSENWTESVERGLAGLRSKSPQFAQQVEAYERATAEVLRWRRRAAQAAANARSKDVPQLKQLLAKAASKEAMVHRSAAQTQPEVTRLTSPAPQLLRDVAAVVLKQAAIAEQLAPSADGSAHSRYRDRVSARVASAQLSPSAIAQLKDDLLVTPTAPPLTLAAAAAVRSAEQGIFVAAGGEISGVELRSLIVPLLKLDADAPSLALGPFPADSSPFEPGAPIEQVRYQFALRPAWLQHEYVFQDVQAR